MSTAEQRVPEAAQLHIRISASDDESDGEQDATRGRGVKDCNDDLSQLAKTAQATAEAVMRVNEAQSSSTISTAVTDPSVATGSGDSISSIQQQQQQVYYIPPVFPCVAYQPMEAAVHHHQIDVSQNLVPTHQNSQTALCQLPQIIQPPPPTVVYQMQQPPQPPGGTGHMMYQVPVVQPQPQVLASQQAQTALIYQVPNAQDYQQCQQQYDFEYAPNTALPTETGDGASLMTSTPKKPMTVGDFVQSSSPKMTYPIVYVSPAGLLTVLLKHDVAVEMTLDRTLRVVNHKHKAAAASNSKGTASCIYHSAAKVYQDSTSCDAEAFLPERQVSIRTDAMQFAFGFQNCYKLNNKTYEFTIAYPKFDDLSQDMSVSLLYSSHKYGPHLMEAYQEVANSATYKKHRTGGTTVYINGLKIYQYPKGDVVVLSGSRYIRVSPQHGSMMVGTHYVDILLENCHTLKVRRGDYRFKVTEDLLVMSDGYMECGIDKSKQVFCQLELVMVRTIIDNMEPCDHSMTGSRENYPCEDDNRPVVTPQEMQEPYGPCMPPPYWGRGVHAQERTPWKRRGFWWRRRGRSHYTIDLQKAIRLANDEKLHQTQMPRRPVSRTQMECTGNSANTFMSREPAEGTQDDDNKRRATVSVGETRRMITKKINRSTSVESKYRKLPQHQYLQGPKDTTPRLVRTQSAVSTVTPPRLWSSIVISPEGANKSPVVVTSYSDSKVDDTTRQVTSPHRRRQRNSPSRHANSRPEPGSSSRHGDRRPDPSRYDNRRHNTGSPHHNNRHHDVRSSPRPEDRRRHDARSSSRPEERRPDANSSSNYDNRRHNTGSSRYNSRRHDAKSPSRPEDSRRHDARSLSRPEDLRPDANSSSRYDNRRQFAENPRNDSRRHDVRNSSRPEDHRRHDDRSSSRGKDRRLESNSFSRYESRPTCASNSSSQAYRLSTSKSCNENRTNSRRDVERRDKEVTRYGDRRSGDRPPQKSSSRDRERQHFPEDNNKRRNRPTRDKLKLEDYIQPAQASGDPTKKGRNAKYPERSVGQRNSDKLEKSCQNPKDEKRNVQAKKEDEVKEASAGKRRKKSMKIRKSIRDKIAQKEAESVKEVPNPGKTENRVQQQKDDTKAERSAEKILRESKAEGSAEKILSESKAEESTGKILSESKTEGSAGKVRRESKPAEGSATKLLRVSKSKAEESAEKIPREKCLSKDDTCTKEDKFQTKPKSDLEQKHVHKAVGEEDSKSRTPKNPSHMPENVPKLKTVGADSTARENKKSPRDGKSPRLSARGKKRRSPREGCSKVSPRNKPLERRNKKKRNSRRYTDEFRADTNLLQSVEKDKLQGIEIEASSDKSKEELQKKELSGSKSDKDEVKISKAYLELQVTEASSANSVTKLEAQAKLVVEKVAERPDRKTISSKEELQVKEESCTNPVTKFKAQAKLVVKKVMERVAEQPDKKTIFSEEEFQVKEESSANAVTKFEAQAKLVVEKVMERVAERPDTKTVSSKEEKPTVPDRHLPTVPNAVQEMSITNTSQTKAAESTVGVQKAEPLKADVTPDVSCSSPHEVSTEEEYDQRLSQVASEVVNKVLHMDLQAASEVVNEAIFLVHMDLQAEESLPAKSEHEQSIEIQNETSDSVLVKSDVELQSKVTKPKAQSDNQEHTGIPEKSQERLLAQEGNSRSLGATTSADHLEAVTQHSKRSCLNAPGVKTSEHNLSLKKDTELRSTKSEDMTSSTSSVGGVVTRGIELQNNSEGNMTQSTAGRMKAMTQRIQQKPAGLQIDTMNIATNEKGSGESAEQQGKKTEFQPQNS